MSKVKATLADVQVSGKFEPAPPDNYIIEIEKIEEKFTPAEGNSLIQRQNFNFELFIAQDGDQRGKKIFHNVAIHKKDGELNPMGAADMKRFFGAVLGVDPNDTSFPWDDQDTDTLIHARFRADVTIDGSYTKPGASKPTLKNVIDSYSITGV